MTGQFFRARPTRSNRNASAKWKRGADACVHPAAGAIVASLLVACLWPRDAPQPRLGAAAAVFTMAFFLIVAGAIVPIVQERNEYAHGASTTQSARNDRRRKVSSNTEILDAGVPPKLISFIPPLSLARHPRPVCKLASAYKSRRWHA